MSHSLASDGGVRRKMLRALTMAVTALVFCFLEQTHADGDGRDPASSAVIYALTSNAAAVERGDLAALSRLWADDETVVVFENGYANYGWADYRDHHLAPELAEMKNVKYHLS